MAKNSDAIPMKRRPRATIVWLWILTTVVGGVGLFVEPPALRGALMVAQSVMTLVIAGLVIRDIRRRLRGRR